MHDRRPKRAARRSEPRQIKTPSQIVRDSNQRLIDAGGCRLTNVMLRPDATAALDALLASGYAPNRTQVIARALMDACKTVQKQIG